MSINFVLYMYLKRIIGGFYFLNGTELNSVFFNSPATIRHHIEAYCGVRYGITPTTQN